MRIWPGLALDSSRAARLTLSPITVYSMRSSVPTVPATASPALTPMPTEMASLPSRARFSLRPLIPACMASAVRIARAEWSGCAIGAPNTAITASPRNLSSVPSNLNVVSIIRL